MDFEYLSQLGDPFVPIELTAGNGDGSTRFLRGEQSLSYFLSWMKLRLEGLNAKDETENLGDAYPREQQAAAQPSLYLAQCPLNLLPDAMRQDLPIPEIVLKAGKGDIYDSSLWMGVPPTVTPLHCDPNPNLLVQLAGEKAIRLLDPQDGRKVVEEVRGRSGAGDMRGEEMMQGEERRMLEEMVWGEGPDSGFEGRGYEVVLRSGDGVFIPKGWWHAVRGLGDIGVSASVSIHQSSYSFIGLLSIIWCSLTDYFFLFLFLLRLHKLQTHELLS